MSPKKAAVLFIGAAGLIAVTLVGVGALDRPATYHGTHLSPAMPPADFTLRSADGVVARRDLAGKVVPIFFGYTSCPDVCPTTLLRLNAALEQLGEAREEVQVVFVSVDPERDSPERASAYAKAIHPSFLGLGGSDEEIADVAAQYGIYHAKADGSDATGYLVDHTATVVVLNREGGVELLWSPTVTAPQMAEDLASLLGRKVSGTPAPTGVTVESSWVRPARRPGGGSDSSNSPPLNSAGYLVLRNPGPEPDAIVAVETELADTVELHSVSMVDGVMRMRPVDSIHLDAGGEAVLAPGGHHLMLIGLDRVLVEGDTVPFRVRFRSGNAIEVRAPVVEGR